MKNIFRVIYLISTFTIIISVYDPYTDCLNGIKVNEEHLHIVAIKNDTALNDTSGDYFLCVWQSTKIVNKAGEVNIKQLDNFIGEELMNIMDAQPIRQTIKDKLRKCDLTPSKVHTETAIKIKNCHAKIVTELLKD
ncbi:hypothetical protein FQA39_LY05353 [Lamprigera yunnana]|nr:hypothetical protein FQA39_LY05353 [Lamprigera yunnana]